MEGCSKEEHGIRFLQYLKFINVAKLRKTVPKCRRTSTKTLGVEPLITLIFAETTEGC
jgi:hypothetical protein